MEHTKKSACDGFFFLSDRGREKSGRTLILYRLFRVCSTNASAASWLPKPHTPSPRSCPGAGCLPIPHKVDRTAPTMPTPGVCLHPLDWFFSEAGVFFCHSGLCCCNRGAAACWLASPFFFFLVVLCCVPHARSPRLVAAVGSGGLQFSTHTQRISCRAKHRLCWPYAAVRFRSAGVLLDVCCTIQRKHNFFFFSLTLSVVVSPLRPSECDLGIVRNCSLSTHPTRGHGESFIQHLFARVFCVKCDS